MAHSAQLQAGQLKALAFFQYVGITTAWIFITHEIRTYSFQLTNVGLWKYSGVYIAPYGLPWYIAYRLFTSYGINIFVLSQALLGLIGVLAAQGWRNWLYGILGGLVFFLWIDDMLFFVLVAYGKWYTSIAALLVKLPLGAPFYVWAFIFHTSAGGLFWDNIVRYIVLGILTVQPLVKRWV